MLNMPSRFVTRRLTGNTYYHVYNRGVFEQNIFKEPADYEKFLYYLYIYVTNPTEIAQKYPDLPTRLRRKNLFNDVFCISYVLMPNHFHLLVKQTGDASMPVLMKQLINGYTTFFNTKYNHHGAILEGRYKSMKIESEYLLTQMVRFVHLNPSISGLVQDPKDYQWSGYSNPIFGRGVMNRFENATEWTNFHLDKAGYDANFEKIRDLTIDSER